MKRKLPILVQLMTVLILCVSFSATLIPPSFLDCVVAIGRIETGPGPLQGQWIAEASGFLYGEFVSKVNNKENNYSVYLVTNRHVIEDHASASNAPLSVKFNLKTAASAQEYEIPLKDAQGKPAWHFHPNPGVDVAVIRINPNFLENQGARFEIFRSDRDVLSRTKAKELGLSEGDGVFILGFPMGLVGQKQDYAIVRQGILARVRDTLDSPNTATTFLVDAFVFPGSSGSPVVLRPEFVSIEGAKPAIHQAYLLGMVRSYIPYTDVAVSLQTKRPRVTFEENSGLAEVIPADYIEETIQDYVKSSTGK